MVTFTMIGVVFSIETREFTTDKGTFPVCTVRVGVRNSGPKGEKGRKFGYFNVDFIGKSSESVAKLEKGTVISILGTQHMDAWEVDGVTKYGAKFNGNAWAYAEYKNSDDSEEVTEAPKEPKAVKTSPVEEDAFAGV